MSDQRTANFSQKGFTKNFLELMTQLEQFKKCCTGFLTQVYTQNSSTVSFTGLGTLLSPLIATAIGGGGGSGTTVAANDGLQVEGPNVIFGNLATSPTGPGSQLTNKVYNQADLSFIWLTDGAFFNTSYDATVDLDPSNNTEIFGFTPLTKVQRDDGGLIYERKVVNTVPVNLRGTGAYHLTVDTVAGMPAGIFPAQFGQPTSLFSALLQQTTNGLNFQFTASGPEISGTRYNSWVKLINANNTTFGGLIPWVAHELPLMISPGADTLGTMIVATNGGYSFGVNAKNNPIYLVNLLQVTTGNTFLIGDGAGSYYEITIPALKTLLGI